MSSCNKETELESIPFGNTLEEFTKNWAKATEVDIKEKLINDNYKTASSFFGTKASRDSVSSYIFHKLETEQKVIVIENYHREAIKIFEIIEIYSSINDQNWMIQKFKDGGGTSTWLESNHLVHEGLIDQIISLSKDASMEQRSGFIKVVSIFQNNEISSYYLYLLPKEQQMFDELFAF